MSSARKICESLHVALLGLCLGMLIMTVVVAVILFPTMRDLDPTLPAYAGFGESHADLAAGKVQSQVFFVADAAQLLTVGLAGLLLIGAIVADARSMGRKLLAVRVLTLAILMGSVGYYLFSLAPRMNEHLLAYWDAARIGETAAAADHRAAFNELHPVAETFMGANALLIALLFALGLVALARGGARATDEASQRSGEGERLEEPRLASARAR